MRRYCLCCVSIAETTPELRCRGCICTKRGFTTGISWIPVQNGASRCVVALKNQSYSILQFYRMLLWLHWEIGYHKTEILRCCITSLAAVYTGVVCRAKGPMWFVDQSKALPKFHFVCCKETYDCAMWKRLPKYMHRMGQEWQRR